MPDVGSRAEQADQGACQGGGPGQAVHGPKDERAERAEHFGGTGMNSDELE